jgi:diketogulonate reductase-like aldo/keto reductase
MAKFIGVSNFNVEELQAAEEALRDKQIACNQILYHLGYRAVERRLLPYCTEHKIAVVGYSPFGHGNFSSPDSAAGRLLTRPHFKTGGT